MLILIGFALPADGVSAVTDSQLDQWARLQLDTDRRIIRMVRLSVALVAVLWVVLIACIVWLM